MALDYRSDALVVWSARGVDLRPRAALPRGRSTPSSGSPPAGRSRASRRFSATTTVRSSPGRIAVAGQTNVYLDISAPGVRFGRPRLLERFPNPDGLRSPQASPSLVRLSSESVMMAWAGSAEGPLGRARRAESTWTGCRRSRRSPPAGKPTRCSPGSQPVRATTRSCCGPSPGPPRRARTDLSRQAIFAARGADASRGRASSARPRSFAPVGPTADPSIAVDPASDRAVTVWRGAGGEIEYAIQRRRLGNSEG